MNDKKENPYGDNRVVTLAEFRALTANLPDDTVLATEGVIFPEAHLVSQIFHYHAGDTLLYKGEAMYTYEHSTLFIGCKTKDYISIMKNCGCSTCTDYLKHELTKVRQ